MSVAYGSQTTVVSLKWTAFKAACEAKRMVMQYDSDDTLYRVFAFDGPELAYESTIHKGEVPWAVISGGYTQEQNDSDKLDFTTNHQAICNKPVNYKLSDGTHMVTPCLFPSGVYLYISGAGDGAGYGDGAVFNIESDTAGDSEVEWSYNDWVLVAGGGILYKDAEIGDYLSLLTYCPATVVTPNGGNTGNCNLSPIGGGVNIIVPAAGDGAYDVDLGSANPVIAPLRDGFYEWSFPNTGKGTVTVGTPMQSRCNLFDTQMNLVRYVCKAPILGSGFIDVSVPAVEPKIVLPHWKAKAVVHNCGHLGLKVAWHVTTARVQTVEYF